MTGDAVKEMAVTAMKAKFGSEVGQAYGFLMFGGFGVSGLVDGAMLATAAANVDNEAGEEFTADMALGLATDLAKALLAATLMKAAPSLIEALGVTADTVASSATIIVTGIFQSTPIGDEWPNLGDPPVTPRPHGPEEPQPAPAPAQPAPVTPAPPPAPSHEGSRCPGAGPQSASPQNMKSLRNTRSSSTLAPTKWELRAIAASLDSLRYSY